MAAAVVLTALAALLQFSGPAQAHSGFQSYVYVSIFDDAMDGRVEYPINDLGPAVGIDFTDEADARLELALAHADEIISYTDTNLDIGDGSETWTLRFDAEFTMLETAAGDYLQVPFQVERIFDAAPREFVTTYSGIIESNPERDALFLVENDWGSATFGNEGEHLLGFSVGNETQQIVIEEVSTIGSMSEVAHRGSVAIDRNLVILVALFTIITTALLVGRRTDDAPPSWRETVALLATRLGWFAVPALAVTGTLGLAGVEITERLAFGVGAVGVLSAATSTRLSSPAAEFAIAGSGAAAGLMLAQTFVFQQLDRSRPILAFFSFSIGVVAATMAFALMLLPLGLLLRRWRRARVIADVVAIGAAVAGAVWLLERIIDIKFPLRTAELTVADLLTSPIVIGVVTAVVAALVLRTATSPPPTSNSGALPADRDTDRIEA